MEVKSASAEQDKRQALGKSEGGTHSQETPKYTIRPKYGENTSSLGARKDGLLNG
jgi:hypothetical protein